MHWLYLLGSMACLGLAMMRSMPTFGVLVFLLGALVLMVAWMLGWMSSRISSQSRDVSHVMGPEELRLLREQAEARKAKATGTPPSDGDA
jgi:hypothetical protein